MNRVWIGLGFAAVPLALFAGAPSSPIVRRVEIRGAITPPTSAHLIEALQEAEREKARALLIEMDTPGGLLDSTREMIQAMLASPVPVIVYVTPQGSRATSAGVFLTMASDVAAMAPETHIGAAHPVSIGSDTRRPKSRLPFVTKASTEPVKPAAEESSSVMEEKAVSDTAAYIRALAKEKGRNADWAERAVRESVSLTADEALRNNVIDLVAVNRTDLFAKLEGRVVAKRGEKITLAFKAVEVRDHPLSAVRKILQTIANPNLAYIFMMLGIYGLIYEFSSPGVGFGAIVGIMSLILAAYSLSILPFNYAGILLILLGMILLALEIKIPSFGLLTVGGTLSLVLGGLFLFDRHDPALRVSLEVIAGTVLATVGFFTLVVAKVIAARRLKPATGKESMIGMTAEVRVALNPRGMVFVDGELWKAVSDAPVDAGATVRITSVEGLILRVVKV